MTKELDWLTLTALMTGLFWMPYVLNRFVEVGVMPAIVVPKDDYINTGLRHKFIRRSRP